MAGLVLSMMLAKRNQLAQMAPNLVFKMALVKMGKKIFEVFSRKVLSHQESNPGPLDHEPTLKATGLLFYLLSQRRPLDSILGSVILAEDFEVDVVEGTGRHKRVTGVLHRVVGDFVRCRNRSFLGLQVDFFDQDSEISGLGFADPSPERRSRVQLKGGLLRQVDPLHVHLA